MARFINMKEREREERGLGNGLCDRREGRSGLWMYMFEKTKPI